MNESTDFKSLDKGLRKQRIIDAAIKIFHEKGYTSTTLDDIAKEVGLSKPALYHYMSSKESLLSIIYIQAVESLFVSAHAIDEMRLEPPEKLRLIIRSHIKHLTDNLAMSAVFFSEENHLPETESGELLIEKRRYTKVVENVIKSGIKQGIFRPINAKMQAYAIIGMCNWLHKWYKPHDNALTPDEIADQFIALLENGYLMVQDLSNPCLGQPPLTRKREILDGLKDQLIQFGSAIGELEKLV